MRSALAHAAVAANRAQRRQRSTSLSTVAPAPSSNDYLPELAAVAASILYRSPLPSREGRPVYILNAAAFPDAYDVDYDTLLSYVLARLPGEDELLSGTEYEVIFFAGGQPDGATTEKKAGPGMGWYLQAYHVLSRATRKRLQRLYIVHPRTWVRVLVGVFGTVVSPKFRRKIVHVNTLTQLALQVEVEKLLIPPSAYLHDRKLQPEIFVPYVSGRRAFGVKHPFPRSLETGKQRLPRVLRETTKFLLMPACVKMEGIFRIPPNATLQSALKEAYDRGQNFIVWKEKDAALVQPGMDQGLVDEVRLEDAYPVHLAASLIKQWYRELREPVVPESSYEAITARFGKSDTVVQPEDLVDLILPDSSKSSLSFTSRLILTRHLLPMLLEVAAHADENKMGAENLAICFSMCLLCGSNQLEDAKMSSIVKRILQAAVEMWPELRMGMGISASSFYDDLQPPADSRDYEDPLEEEISVRTGRGQASDGTHENDEGHRIEMEDAEDGVGLRDRTPIQQTGTARPRAPTLPPRPVVAAAPATDELPVVPKRKPAPPVTVATETQPHPPRYSTVFDPEGHSINTADSPASYPPANGFGPSRHGLWNYDEAEKKGFTASPQIDEPAPVLTVPKRKAVSGEVKTTETREAKSEQPSEAAESPKDMSDGISLAAQEAAAILAGEAAAAFAGRSGRQTPETEAKLDDHVFRKPSWPASSRPLIQPQSLAKPVLPPRHSSTFPLASGTQMNPQFSHGLIPHAPKPRAPSPGLLKRMSEMTISNSEASNEERLRVKRLDMRKASVEDLRRLYEERGRTVESLAKAEAWRRGSGSTI